MELKIELEENTSLKSWREQVIKDQGLDLTFQKVLLHGQKEINPLIIAHIHEALKIAFCSEKQLYFNYQAKQPPPKNIQEQDNILVRNFDQNKNKNNNNCIDSDNIDQIAELHRSELFFSSWTWLIALKKFYFMTESLHEKGFREEQQLLFSHFAKLTRHFCIKGDLIKTQPDAEFEHWLDDNGVVRSVQVALSPEFGGRTLVAKKKLQPFDKIFEIPRNFLLNRVTTFEAPGELGDALRQLKEEKVDADFLTMLFILYQKKILGEKSNWHRFFNTIPEPLDLPLLYPIECLLELDGTPVLDEIITIREELQELHSEIMPVICSKFPKLFPKDTFAFEDFLWLRAVFDSRAFMIKIDNQQVPSLVPFADCANHSERAQITIVRFNNETQRLTYQTCVPVEEAEHVFLSYGEFSNRELFLFYGYVDEGNTLDAVEISLTVGSEDFEERMQLLQKYQLRIDQHYLRNGPLAETLKAGLRIATCDGPSFEVLKKDAEANPRPTLAYSMVSQENELFIYETLDTMIQEILDNFDSTLEEDQEFLEDPEEAQDEPNWPKRRLCIQYRILQKKILLRAKKEVAQTKENLTLQPDPKKLKNEE